MLVIICVVILVRGIFVVLEMNGMVCVVWGLILIRYILLFLIVNCVFIRLIMLSLSVMVLICLCMIFWIFFESECGGNEYVELLEWIFVCLMCFMMLLIIMFLLL